MKNMIDSGETVAYTAGADIAAGDLVVLGTMAGIAINDIANGATGLVAIKGSYTLTKKTASDVVAQGNIMVDDSGVKVMTAGSTLAAVIIGRAVAGSANGVTTVKVKLGM